MIRRLLAVASLLIWSASTGLLAPDVARASCHPPDLFEPSVVVLSKFEPNSRDATVPVASRYTGTEQPRLPGGGCPPGLYPGTNGSGQPVCFDCGGDAFDVETNQCVVCPAGRE